MFYPIRMHALGIVCVLQLYGFILASRFYVSFENAWFLQSTQPSHLIIFDEPNAHNFIDPTLNLKLIVILDYNKLKGGVHMFE